MTPITTTKRRILNALRASNKSLSKKEGELFSSFVRHTVGKIRSPFLAQHSPKEVVDALYKAFTFVRERPGHLPKVHIEERTSRGVSIFCSMGDQPFIVDTIRLFLRKRNAPYFGGFNLVFKAGRDANGRLISVDGEDDAPESVVMLEADSSRDILDHCEEATEQLAAHLTLSQTMVRDFHAMLQAVEDARAHIKQVAAEHPELAEACNETVRFLRWLQVENFVFMGVETPKEKLGFQTIKGIHRTRPTGEWPAPHAPSMVRVRKSQTDSPVHRNGRIDEILIEVQGKRVLFLQGMFTYRAVTQPGRNVPILRHVLRKILAQQEQEPGSFRYKGIANVFDSLPTEFLFTASESAIASMVDRVFESEQQQEVDITVLATGRHSAFCLVAMPKSGYSESVRSLIEKEIVGGLNASYSDDGVFVGRFDTVLLHYFMTGASFPDEPSLAALQDRVRQIATPWRAQLWNVLAEEQGEEVADRLTDTYGKAFPEAWYPTTSPERAVIMIDQLERLSSDSRVLAEIFRNDREQMVLNLYQSEDYYLTAILPVLDNFGLVVMASEHIPVQSRGGLLDIDSFLLEANASDGADSLIEHGEQLTRALRAVFAGDVESCPLNALVLTAGLSWEQVDVLRAYVRYSRQIVQSLTVGRTTEVLLRHPTLCHALTQWFAARFDPDLNGKRVQAQTKCRSVVEDGLRLLRSHDEDLVFSTLAKLIGGTLRTNAYRTDRSQHYLSFKLDPSRIQLMGSQPPLFEIYVHHRQVEGVHLRFGRVARGGLRWSDRDDFRTEVLGLATTQLVKNVVIVPTGSKGGFFLRQPSADSAERRAEADLHYETFIRGLLDLTDNAVEGKIVPPQRVVRHDDDDPYLVVAADKGTAHLSDTANRLSQDYGYWLGDAFASGGSNGYDHKGVGITARGAWALVRRHFAEMGRDPYKEPFTAVGIGAMGGDVFGNGMVESPKVLLRAAFNHLHIFLDPDPHPKNSHKELRRLFKTRGGWDQFKEEALSTGGGVFDRRAKSMPLSVQVQEMLGLEQDEAQPEQVIHHILKMDVDLLWNGGIGTYVKASHETHSDADDRSNNAVRVDSPMLRARVVGEGGNLGFTAAARNEAHRHGVRLNTDFIDNSGGVDLSDHEVNLKILLGGVVARGELSENERNDLLRDMTDEVAALVLANNDAHGRQISRDEIRSKQDIFQFGRAIAFIERVFDQDREALHLPTNEELRRRAEAGEGLTRPELAALSSWVKMHLQKALLEDDPMRIPGAEGLLMAYFPERIQRAYEADIRNHMLAKEIVAMMACTQVVADAGAAFLPMALETTGASVTEILSAYLKAQVVGRAHDVRSTLEELRTSVSLGRLYRAWVMVDSGVRELMRFWLSTRGRIPPDEDLKEMSSAIDQVYKLQSQTVTQRDQKILEGMRADDIPSDAALQILKSRYLNVGLMIWAEARRLKRPFKELIIQHLAVAQASRLQEVLEGLAQRPASGRWDPIALKILHSRYHQLLRLLVTATPFAGPSTSVDRLEPKLSQGALADVRRQVDALLEGETEPSIATLLVLEERLTSAIDRIPKQKKTR